MKRLAFVFSIIFGLSVMYAQAQYKSPAQSNHKMSKNRINTKGVKLEAKKDNPSLESKKIVLIRMPEKAEPSNVTVISNKNTRNYVASDKTAKRRSRYMIERSDTTDNQFVTNKNRKKNIQLD